MGHCVKSVNTFLNLRKFTENSFIIVKNVTIFHVSVGFIYGMLGCAILDLPFGWERGTDEDGTLIFIE